jgi:predicted negative regulator of RcsB-dependent stress response
MSKYSPLIAAGVGIVIVVAVGGGLVYWMNQRNADTVVISSGSAPAVTSSAPPAVQAKAPGAPAGAAQSLAAIARSPVPPAMTADEQAAVTSQLGSDKPDDQKLAIDKIRGLETSDPRSLANGLTVWLGPLMMTRQYAVVEEATLPAIMDRSFDNKMVPAAQQARVMAFAAEQKYPQALSEAKAYYNIAPLTSTEQAVSLIAQILGKTGGAGAATFQSEQSASIAADAAVPTTSDVLKNIKVDETRYDAAIQGLVDRVGKAGDYTYSNWDARGNMFLLEDRPAEARQCFENALKVAGAKAKDIREGLEGVAKSIRDTSGQAGPANAFILAIQTDPEKAGAGLFVPGGSPSAENLRTAANQTILAGRTTTTPAR